MARGVFSNEAGLGSAAISAASARTDSPARQGYISMTGIVFDTLILCTVTGLAICASGVLGAPEAQGVDGAALTILAFQTVLGQAGGALVSVCVTLFAFSTIIGWYFFGETNVKYLFGKKAVPVYSALVIVFVVLGSLMKVDLVWSLSDMFNGLMVLPNLIGVLALTGVVASLSKEHDALRGKRK